MVLKDIFHSHAHDRALEVFRTIMADKGPEVCFEQEFRHMEGVFQDEILQVGKDQHIPLDECYRVHFELWGKSELDLKKECREILLGVQKERAAEQIRITTTECIVEPQVRRIGLPYRLEFQKYRVKVTLRLDWSREFAFYVRYRDLGNHEIISSIPERTRDAMEYIKMFGPQVSIRKCSCTEDWKDPEEGPDSNV